MFGEYTCLGGQGFDVGCCFWGVVYVWGQFPLTGLFPGSLTIIISERDPCWQANFSILSPLNFMM